MATTSERMTRLNRIINRKELHRQYRGEELFLVAAQEAFCERIEEVRSEHRNWSFGECMQVAAERWPDDYEGYLAAVGARGAGN